MFRWSLARVHELLSDTLQASKKDVSSVAEGEQKRQTGLGRKFVTEHFDTMARISGRYCRYADREGVVRKQRINER